MAVEVKMPQLGESVFEGTIGRWLKRPGDAVEKYEPLLEVITDKVDTEITAVESGTLLSILVPEGETVKVGTVLAMLGEAGETVTPAASGAAPAASGTAASPASAGAGSAAAAPAAPSSASSSAPSSPAPTAAANGPAPAQATSGTAPRVSPVAARVAAEHGVDLAQVPGTGRGGQITREDVERFVGAQAAAAPAPITPAAAAPTAAPTPAAARRDLGFISPRVARLAAESGVDLRLVPGTGRDSRITARDVERYVESGAPLRQPAAAAATAPAAAAMAGAASAAPAPATGTAPAGFALGELIQMTPMRTAIAAHMVHSKHTSPHVTTVHEVDMGAVLAAQSAQKGAFYASGVKLTLTAFIMEALARAIHAHPLVNSSWTDAGIQIHRDINLGLAVALPNGGLIVPVIKNADEKNLMGMAKAVNDLATRARGKQLKPDDVQGGTLTVTNYGTLGSLFGTPVINQPQTAILGTGAIKKRVVVVESPAGDAVAIRPMMYLALTFDHRVLDGGTADPFMQTLVRYLENYEA